MTPEWADIILLGQQQSSPLWEGVVWSLKVLLETLRGGFLEIELRQHISRDVLERLPLILSHSPGSAPREVAIQVLLVLLVLILVQFALAGL